MLNIGYNACRMFTYTIFMHAMAIAIAGNFSVYEWSDLFPLNCIMMLLYTGLSDLSAF